MALATYADLETQVANWLHRDDLTTYIPDFITLFEADAARRMMVRPQQATTTLTPTSGSVALPSDYIGWIRLTWTGSTRVDLQYVGPTILQAYYPSTPTNTPQMFTLEGGNILIRPVDGTALEFVYYQKTAALSSALNWLYTNHPDAYLNGTLYEAYKFAKDNENMATYKALRDEIFDEIRVQNFRQAGHLSIRPLGPIV